MAKPERDDKRGKKKDKNHKRLRLDGAGIEIDDAKPSEAANTMKNKRRPNLNEGHVESKKKNKKKPRLDLTLVENNEDEVSEMPKKKKDRKKLISNETNLEHDERNMLEVPNKKRNKKKHKSIETNVEDDKVLDMKDNGAIRSSGAMNRRGNGRDGETTDTRFATMHSDPIFQRMPKREEKVEVDARFARMFSDERFATGSAAPIDKRGKLRKRKQKQENPLLRYYIQGDENQEVVEDGDEEMIGKESRSKLEREASSEDDLQDSSSDLDERSSTDEDDDDDQHSVDSEVWRCLTANQQDAPKTDQETHRLAVMNMDWDHIKAVDLFMVMNSCLRRGGIILSVTIYPSNLGLKCMEVEAVRGPFALIDTGDSQSDDETEIGDQKLRKYELNKLRYYFAVVVCDSAATANYLYESLDGTEFLRTSNVFDLRFIPDSTEFNVAPRELVTEPPANYEVPDFHTRALQHSEVKLSWEEDEPNRKKILRRKFDSNQLDDLDAFIASSGGESDDDNASEDGNNAYYNGDAEALPKAKAKKRIEREKLLSLLQPADGSDSDKGDDDKDMEVTFNTGLEDLSKRILEKKDRGSETYWEKVLRERSEKKKAWKKKSKYSSDNDSSDFDTQEAPVGPDDFFIDEPSTADAKDNKQNGKKGITKTAGKSNRKQREESVEMKEEQEATREELELLFADDQDAANGLKGYNLKPKKAKGKKGKNNLPNENKLPNPEDIKDPRFSGLGSNLYALDPTDPQFKRSAAYAQQQIQKQRK